MKEYKYIINCVNSTASAINNMVDDSIDITYETLIKHIPLEELRSLFSCYSWNGKGLQLKNDYAVRFCRSRYKGERCYYICHSAIEYVFVRR